MRRPSPLATAAAGLTLLASGAAVARAQDGGDACAAADLRFGGVTYYVARDFRRDEDLSVRGVRVIVHNRTRVTGLSVGGVPRIVRGRRIAVTGPTCRVGAAVPTLAASSISAAD